MSKRKQLYRERLEVYLVNIIMAYRPVWMILGLLIIAFSIAILTLSPLAAVIMQLVGIWMLLLVWTYKAVLLTARGSSWAGALWERESGE